MRRQKTNGGHEHRQEETETRTAMADRQRATDCHRNPFPPVQALASAVTVVSSPLRWVLNKTAHCRYEKKNRFDSACGNGDSAAAPFAQPGESSVFDP
jgi:hypothetical protein